MNPQPQLAALPRRPVVPSLARPAVDGTAATVAAVPGPARDPRARRPAPTKLTLGIPVRIPARVLPETRDPARWTRFEALVLEAGVSRARLLDAFPGPEDVEDILRTPEADLPACAETVVRALAATPSPVPEPRAGGATVRCADCRHFARSARHPRLGRCGAGETATAAGGWWDTQRRHCVSFVVSSD